MGVRLRANGVHRIGYTTTTHIHSQTIHEHLDYTVHSTTDRMKAEYWPTERGKDT
jgi:hypothetical protein